MTYTVGCNYLSLPLIPASDTKLIACKCAILRWVRSFDTDNVHYLIKAIHGYQNRSSLNKQSLYKRI